MVRKDYQEKLESLRSKTVEMSEIVGSRLKEGLETLETKDEDLAWKIIKGDSKINNLYLEVEDECVDLLALQQPVAGDLRFIVASFKISTDLERVGDLAVNLADYSQEIDSLPIENGGIQDVGDDAFSMLEKAMKAYKNEDKSLCYEVVEQDEELDNKCEKLVKKAHRNIIRDLKENEEPPLTIFLAVRDLERVGDHAVNIAGRSLYMIDGNRELLW